MGPKKRKGSPSKSEPGGSRSNNSLLKSAISKSRSERNTSIRSGSIADITNIQHRSNLSTISTSSLDGTAKKRGKALAAFRQFQETVTPRTAMTEFMAAHQSSVQTPAMFFPTAQSDSAMGSYVASKGAHTGASTGHINASSLISDMSDNVTVNTDQDDPETDISTGSEPVIVRSRRRNRTKGGVTLEEVDPDRDITRPTNRSRNTTGQDNLSSYPLSDESANETMEVQVRRGKRRKTEYKAEDFDFSIAMPGSQQEGVASNTHSQTGLGRTLADSVYQVDRSLDITDEVAEKLRLRKEKITRRQTRHQPRVDAGDFSGLETPVQKKVVEASEFPEVESDDLDEEGEKTLVGEELNSELHIETTEAQISNVDVVKTTQLGRTPGTTLADLSQETETPVPAKRRRQRRGEYKEVAEKEFNFTDIPTPHISVASEPEDGGEVSKPIDVLVNTTDLCPTNSEADTSSETPVRKVKQRRGQDVAPTVFTGISLAEKPNDETITAQGSETEASKPLDGLVNTTDLCQSKSDLSPSEVDTSNETPVRKVRQRRGKDVAPTEFTGIPLAEKPNAETVTAQCTETLESTVGTAAQPTPGPALGSSHLSMGQTTIGLTLEEEEETPVRKIGRAAKTKMTVDVGEFTDISLHPQHENDQEKTKAEAGQLERNTTSQPTPGQTLGSTHLTMGQTMMGFTITDEETPVRNTRALKKKVDIDAAEFTDLSLQLEGVQTTPLNPTVETQAPSDPGQPTPDQTLGSTHITVGHTMLGFTMNEEDTPVRTTRAAKRKVEVNIADFTDISVQEHTGQPNPSQSQVTQSNPVLSTNSDIRVETEGFQVDAPSKLGKVKSPGTSKTLSHASPEEDGNSSHDSIKVSRRLSAKNRTSATLPYSPIVNTPSPRSRTLTNKMARKEEQVHSNEDSKQEVKELNDANDNMDNVTKEASNQPTNNPWVDDDTTDVAHTIQAATETDIITATTSQGGANEEVHPRKEEQQYESVQSEASTLSNQVSKAEVSSQSVEKTSSMIDNTSLENISLYNTLPVKRGRVKPAVGVDMDEFDISLPFTNTEAGPAELLEEDDNEPLSQEDKDAQFSETKARRAARKSEVLGHLVRAPNLSNIVETSEVPSRPSSGMRTSSELASRRSSTEMSSKRNSTEVKSARASGGLITSIVEEGEEDNAPAEKVASQQVEHPEDAHTKHIVQAAPPNIDPSNPVQDPGEELNYDDDYTDSPATNSRRLTSRKSLYQAGLPDLPLDNSMLCDQTKVFRPEVESTRLGNMTGLMDLSPVQGARPGRDTSTPDITKTRAKGRVAQNEAATPDASEPPTTTITHPGNSQSMSSPSEKLPANTNTPTIVSRSYLPSVPSKLTLNQTQPACSTNLPSQPVVRLSKTLANKSLMSVTSGTQYETPEQVREARRSSRRSNLKMSLYTTRMDLEDIAEGGTQTTPTLELTKSQPQVFPPKVLAQLSDTGCQVTPGLAAPQLHHTVIGQDRDDTPRTHVGVGQDSNNQMQDEETRTGENMENPTEEKSITVSTSTSPITVDTNGQHQQFLQTSMTKNLKPTTDKQALQSSVSEEFVDHNAASGYNLVEKIVQLNDGQIRKRRVDHAKVRVEVNELNDRLEEAIRKENYPMAEKVEEELAVLIKRQEKLEVEIQTRETRVTIGMEGSTDDVYKTVATNVENSIAGGDENHDEVNEDEAEDEEEHLAVTEKESSSDDVDNDIDDIVKNISANISRDHFEEKDENQEWAFPQYNQEKSQVAVNNSLAEVDLDDAEHQDTSEDESGGPELNITGRKNPSPVLERRPEVDVDTSDNDDDIESSKGNFESDAEPEDNPNKSNLDTPDPSSPRPMLQEFSPNTSGPVGRVPPTAILPVQLQDPEERVLPSARERKEMRQATLARYLGIQDVTAKQGLDTLLTPQHQKQPLKKKAPPAKPKVVKPQPKTTFPPKNIKFDYNRFSRFKMKKDAEDILVEASQDFMELAMARLSDLAKDRGAEKIHLCDIRRLMGECGFVVPVEQDPANRYLNSTLRDVAREDLVRELIPCSVGDGTVYPPVDCWKEKGGKKKAAKGDQGGSKAVASGSRASVGKGSTGRKADKVKRFKVSEDLDTTEPKRPRVESGKNGGKGKKNRSQH